MPPRAGARRSRERVETLALVVRRVPVGDADLLVTFVTRERGLVSASARAARRPTSRLGALEPMHTLRVVLEVGEGEPIAKLREARIERPRTRLVEDERRLAAAAEIVSCARRIVAEGQQEAEAFDVVEEALDRVSTIEPERAELAIVRATALLLAASGYALELSACVRCGAACPPRSAALVDPAAGGLVCRACGGGPILLAAGQRERVARALASEGEVLEPEDLDVSRKIVAAAIAAHGRAPQGSR